MTFDAIVQARVGSTRLPGKILKNLAGKPVLLHVLERLKQSKHLGRIVVATTEKPEDSAVVDLAKKEGVLVFRGSETNVLERFAKAAEQLDMNLIVRVTSDCPLLDPVLLDLMIEQFKKRPVDYLSNTQKRTFPLGLDLELFTKSALLRAYNEASSQEDKEHVTPYIYREGNGFSLANLAYTSDFSALRWTLDTEEDFLLISKIYDALYPNNPQFRTEDVLHLLDLHPEWKKINANVRQKTLSS